MPNEGINLILSTYYNVSPYLQPLSLRKMFAVVIVFIGSLSAMLITKCVLKGMLPQIYCL